MSYKVKDLKNFVDGIDKTTIKDVYKSPYVRNKGFTCKNEGNKLYTEIVAERLLAKLSENNNLFNDIAKTERSTDYIQIKSHTGLVGDELVTFKSGEKIGVKRFQFEKWIAKFLFGKSVSNIGKFIDYEVPLNKHDTDGYGEIDLLAYNKDDKILRIIELKRPDNSETLLRAVLEGYTYYRTVQLDKLIGDIRKNFPDLKLPIDDKDIEIRVCPLFFKGSQQDIFKDCQPDNKFSKHPMIYDLMKELSSVDDRKLNNKVALFKFELLRFTVNLLQDKDKKIDRKKFTEEAKKEGFLEEIESIAVIG